MPTRTITTKSLAILIACLTPAVAEPLSITGPARVVDGDTVVVAGTHVRLKGLDAAERGTPLGEQAKQVMEGIVTCTLTGEHTWHREVGYCTNAAGTIEMGAALACPRYSTRYVQFEQAEALAAQPRATYCVRHDMED